MIAIRIIRFLTPSSSQFERQIWHEVCVGFARPACRIPLSLSLIFDSIKPLLLRPFTIQFSHESFSLSAATKENPSFSFRMLWPLISLFWWYGTSSAFAIPTTESETWKCPEIAQQPIVECSCDMPHTLRCTGDRTAMQIIGRLISYYKKNMLEFISNQV